MKIDFISHIPDGYLPNKGLGAYTRLVDHHLELLRLQSRGESFSWKVLHVFYAVIFMAFILQAREIIPNAAILILPSGIASMLLFMRRAIGDRTYITDHAECVQRGVALEIKHNLPGGIFQFHEENRSLAYKRIVLPRLLIFFLIGVPMVIAGIALSAIIDI